MARSKTVKSADGLLELCRRLPGTTEDVKWGDNFVFSVGGRMYALFDMPDFETFSLKVDPVTFDVLTTKPGIEPAPYMARASWIRFESRDLLPEDALVELFENSHALVAAKLTKKRQRELGLLDRAD